MHVHKWSLNDVNNMAPYERQTYLLILNEWIEAENERAKKENAKYG